MLKFFLKFNGIAQKQGHIKEKKLNLVLIQNNKILVFFLCLQAKLQLLQKYRALFANFFGSRSRKAGIFEVERLPKKFCKSRQKPLFRPTEH